MKKIALFMLATFFGLSFVQAQGDFKAGIHAGLPIGDAGDFATFAIAIDLGYLFDVSDEFQVGPTAGYSHSFGDEIGGFEVDDVQFLPIAAAGRFSVSDEFSLGADLGYAIGISDGNDGGFYYAPKAAYSVSELMDIVLAYRGVALDGGSWDIISLGVEFNLN
ncbi:hypothetical protein J4E06_15330 [Muricauda sp. NFXS6]|uniref:outer membrane beta-barrel protein n=1 Tax=Allomuricauda sp. NFXS6 TaxID=2819094 RepID=UPI0032DEA5DC